METKVIFLIQLEEYCVNFNFSISVETEIVKWGATNIITTNKQSNITNLRPGVSIQFNSQFIVGYCEIILDMLLLSPLATSYELLGIGSRKDMFTRKKPES